VLRISCQVGTAVELFGAWLSPSESIAQLQQRIQMLIQPAMTADVVWALQERPAAADMQDHELLVAVGRMTAACLTVVQQYETLKSRSLMPVGTTATAQLAHEKLLIALRVLERAMDKVS
jgi:hypothetical protein